VNHKTDLLRTAARWRTAETRAPLTGGRRVAAQILAETLICTPGAVADGTADEILAETIFGMAYWICRRRSMGALP
jgi:hypothetical protein